MEILWERVAHKLLKELRPARHDQVLREACAAFADPVSNPEGSWHIPSKAPGFAGLHAVRLPCGVELHFTQMKRAGKNPSAVIRKLVETPASKMHRAADWLKGKRKG